MHLEIFVINQKFIQWQYYTIDAYIYIKYHSMTNYTKLKSLFVTGYLQIEPYSLISNSCWTTNDRTAMAAE